tara:strand:+ start:126 stop:440 length:315 start_codon:yes stop_codon:yes gene_type:complete
MKVIVFFNLALAVTASAFVPSAISASRPTFLAAEPDNNAATDDNFDDVDLVKSLGLRRLKKLKRKHARRLNDRIQNFEVVQDGEEYVAATAEQIAQMKEAAKGN